MSIVGLVLNLLLVGLLVAALGVGLRLNRRLKTLRDSQEGFASAVKELNAAAARAEQGLADLRAATDEALDLLSDRIEKGRALAAKLERIADRPAVAAPAAAPAPTVSEVETVERRFGALLAAAREARVRPEPPRRELPAFRRPADADADDELFEEPLMLRAGAAR
jgi:hypothetical protein